jgi:hypothetical protein
VPAGAADGTGGNGGIPVVTRRTYRGNARASEVLSGSIWEVIGEAAERKSFDSESFVSREPVL